MSPLEVKIDASELDLPPSETEVDWIKKAISVDALRLAERMRPIAPPETNQIYVQVLQGDATDQFNYVVEYRNTDNGYYRILAPARRITTRELVPLE